MEDVTSDRGSSVASSLPDDVGDDNTDDNDAQRKNGFKCQLGDARTVIYNDFDDSSWEFRDDTVTSGNYNENCRPAGDCNDVAALAADCNDNSILSGDCNDDDTLSAGSSKVEHSLIDDCTNDSKGESDRKNDDLSVRAPIGGTAIIDATPATSCPSQLSTTEIGVQVDEIPRQKKKVKILISFVFIIHNLTCHNKDNQVQS